MSKQKDIWMVIDSVSREVILFSKKEQAIEYATKRYDVYGENSYYYCYYIEDPMKDVKAFYEIAPAIYDDGVRYPHNDDPNEIIAIVKQVTVPSATRKQWWVYQDNCNNGHTELFTTKKK